MPVVRRAVLKKNQHMLCTPAICKQTANPCPALFVERPSASSPVDQRKISNRLTTEPDSAQLRANGRCERRQLLGYSRNRDATRDIWHSSAFRPPYNREYTNPSALTHIKTRSRVTWEYHRRNMGTGVRVRACKRQFPQRSWGNWLFLAAIQTKCNRVQGLRRFDRLLPTWQSGKHGSKSGCR